MGSPVLLVHDICSIVYGYCSVPKYYYMYQRSLGMVIEKSDIAKRNFTDHLRTSVCAWYDRLGSFPNWWKKYHGYRRFFCKQQPASTWFPCLSVVLCDKIRMGMG